MMTAKPLLAGAALGLGARALLGRALLTKLQRDLERLNAGDYRPLLAGYADDAVLVFNEGDHRWAGEHRGRAAIERFLQDFTTAGLQGKLSDVMFAGPPWALRMMARFDDRAFGTEGDELYRNRVVLSVQTRFGKIVRHEDFYEDTKRIEVFEQRLRELGVRPAGEPQPVAS
jgi:ketosteroid isomerase-like protein